MAVSRREKASDVKYSAAIGDRPETAGREFELEDVIEDLRDDINDVCDLANLVDGFSFAYTAPARGARAKLTITHTSSGKTFIIDASN
tara:strand:- start:471 stop:734 length:264 start_codon:yes stop_codon:yes gene_type:complete